MRPGERRLEMDRSPGNVSVLHYFGLRETLVYLFLNIDMLKIIIAIPTGMFFFYFQLVWLDREWLINV